MSEMAQSQLRIPDDEIDFSDDLIYFYAGKRFTGVSYDDVPGYGLSEITYLDGLQEGPARDWYASGQLKSEANFHRNVRHGVSREWAESGELQKEDLYEFGVHVRSHVFGDCGEVTVAFELSDESPNFALLKQMREQAKS